MIAAAAWRSSVSWKEGGRHGSERAGSSRNRREGGNAIEPMLTGHLVPHPPIEGAPGALLVRAAPLLEEERHARPLAENEAGRSLRFTSDTDHVTVRLGRRAAAGDTAVFTLAYHTHPERGIYFVPRKHVVWSQGEAEETRAWVPTYDHANDKATWEMLVTADSAMKVLSTGRLLSVEPVDGGAPPARRRR